MTSQSLSHSPSRTLRTTTAASYKIEWNSQECVVAEKWSLENFVRYRIAILCAQYYQTRYLLLAVPGAIFAFLAAPGQWLYEATKYASGISLLLATMSIVGGLLQLMVLLFKLAE